MKKFLTHVAAAAILSLAGAGAAHAEVFKLTLADPVAGLTGSPYGEVDVFGEGTTTMSIVVSLYGTNDFHWSKDPNHEALAFDLVGNPLITISDLPTPFASNGPLSAGSVSATPFGTFDYAIEFPKAGGKKPPPMPLIQSFGFTLTSASNLTLEATHSDTYGDVFFSTDIVQPGGLTGNVGALRTPPPPITPGGNVPGPGVPEPATWAMMIVGFAGVGALLRRTRREALATLA